MNSTVLFILALAWTIVVLVASVIPLSININIGSGLSFLPVKGDKILHFVAYFTLVFFWALYAFSSDFDSKKKVLITVVLGCILYSIFIEMIQGYLSYRSFEWGDIGANITGAVIGGLASVLLSKANSNKDS